MLSARKPVDGIFLNRISCIYTWYKIIRGIFETFGRGEKKGKREITIKNWNEPRPVIIVQKLQIEFTRRLTTLRNHPWNYQK